MMCKSSMEPEKPRRCWRQCNGTPVSKAADKSRQWKKEILSYLKATDPHYKPSQEQFMHSVNTWNKIEIY